MIFNKLNIAIFSDVYFVLSVGQFFTQQCHILQHYTRCKIVIVYSLSPAIYSK